MLKKLVQKFIFFIYGQWASLFVSCPYINNEAKYMAKGVKPFTSLGGSQEYLDYYEYPHFKKLLEDGVVLEYKTSKKIIDRFGKEVDFINLYFYYPDEEWRVKRCIIIWDNLDKYIKTIDARYGLLLGYPKKYIRRWMLSQKIQKWLRKKELLPKPPWEN